MGKIMPSSDQLGECRDCGAPLGWFESKTGKKYPLAVDSQGYCHHGKFHECPQKKQRVSQTDLERAAEPKLTMAEPEDLKTCNKCGAYIYWCESKNGKNYPVDIDPNELIIRRGAFHSKTCAGDLPF